MPAGVEGSFNSRTPEGVRQHYANYSTKQTNVSIHEPREGCDCTPPCQACPYPCFNSRTPGGVRPRGVRAAWPLGGFNSRTPGGVRPLLMLGVSILLMFQFTHPGRGATWVGDIWTLSRESFNSRTPGGVRQQRQHVWRHYERVSIHAPREGCDSEILILDDQPSMFQFTHPGRGATGSGAGFPPRELSFNSRTPGGVRRH